MQSRQSGPHQTQCSRQQGNPVHLARLQESSANQLNGKHENTASVIPRLLNPSVQLMNRKQDNSSHQLAGQLDSSASHHPQQLNPVSQLARKKDGTTAKFADEFEDTGCNEDMMERELMATLDEGLDVKDCQTQIELSTSAKVKGQMARQSNQGDDQGHQQRSKSAEEAGGDGFQENDLEILQRMQLLDHERTSLAQQIESEEKNRKWYYDQIDMTTRKIRSLPAIDGHPNQQPGLTRKHLEFEISRLRQTMLESFGTNEQIQQRRDTQMQNIHQIEAEMIVLQQHHEQLMQQKQAKLLEGQGFGRFPSSSDTIHSSGSGDHDAEQVTMAVSMATQTEERHHEQHPIPDAIYHGTWPIDENAQGSSAGMLQNGDLASVMSFNSTNTSSSRGSSSGGHVWTMHQQPQTTPQATGLVHPIPPQQLGKKQDMLYGLMSMLGAQDKDDMSRTLLAMSSSHDSCIAMRQSGCLPLLVQLLHGSDKDSSLLGNTRGSKAARIRAAAALHNIVHSHPDDKRGRKEARVLRLLEQIRAHCDQLKETSSDEEDDGKSSVSANIPMNPHPGPVIATLMKLSFDEEHRHAICTLGGLHAIAELLAVDSDVNRDTDDQYSITIRRYACMALTNLTFGDGTNKALLCSMKGSMEALVSQLLSANEELCQVAASVLRNLSWKADMARKKTLREVGAVTLLMQASMRVEKESTLKSILSALWNLSAHCNENKADICAVERALEFLISILQYKSPSKTTAIIENGSGVLRNVSSHIAVREDYRQILRQYGCLQILLKHLRSPSLTIVSNACGTLWNLSARCAEDQQALWEMGAVGMLRNLVNSKHKMISMGSSAALKNLLAARPAMKNMELNKQANVNRPTLHARKQRAFESEIDQNLSETCENVESPRDSPVETKKASGHFVYPVYPGPDNDCPRSGLRNQVLPRSQSGDNALCAAECQKNPQGPARSGSQDSVGSTHSDISHDRSHHASGGKGPMVQVNMGGSLDRNKETLTNHCGQGQRIQFDGRTERNPLGVSNSRILQVMQEVAVHAGIDGQSHDSDSSAFKAPIPVSSIRSLSHPATQQQSQNSNFPAHLYGTPQQTLPYHMYMMTNIPQTSITSHLNITSHPSYPIQRNQDDNDEKPLDYSMKYREGTSVGDSMLSQSLPKQPMVGNFGIKQQMNHNVSANLNNAPVNNPCYSSQAVNNNRFGCHSAYAETDLDDPDQTTDYSARYGVDYNTEQYKDNRINYGASYNGSDPNCADCKLEEARRYNDRLEQTICDDQIKTFCTEDTPYLSTATSLTDLSTGVKILEEAEEHCPVDAEDDVPQNFSSKYGESDQAEIGHERGKRSSLRLNEISQSQQQLDGDKSSRSGSQMTDIQTGTTVIANYHLKTDRRSQETNSNESYEPEERSFHDNRNDDAPMDHTKIYCEEGTPVCFSRVSSLSSLHSSEAADKQDKRLQGPLKKIEEKEDVMNNSTMKMQPPPLTPNSFRQKSEQPREINYHHNEKEQKTVTFDDKEQVQETPMMFSRSTSLGSLSSFDTQSVHSSVFSEYSRRASEVVSPSELPDSPSETMPPSPRRAKSPDQINRKMELYPRNRAPQKFTTNIITNSQGINPLTRYNVDKPVDFDTGSCKSEAPVVYADEGTPPIFSDNLSELSCITGNNYGINNKTLVHNDSKNSQNFISHRNVPESGIKWPLSNNDVVHSSGSKEALQGTTVQSTKITNETPENTDSKLNVNIRKDADNQCKGINKKAEIAGKGDENGIYSNSDVSEGEDDILANIISSAMPLSSKRIKKSSSDNAIKRKSCQQDNCSSSKSKTPAKCQSESSSKSSSVSNSAKKSVKLDPADAGLPDGTDVKSSPKCHNQIVPGHGKDGNSPIGKQRSQIPRPLQHRQLQQLQNVTSLNNTSSDSGSASSYTDDDSPFNVSNTQSVIARSAQVTCVTSTPKAKLSSIKPSPLILQKAKSLSNADVAPNEGLKTYATEDTPFSGSLPGSPGNTQKHFSNLPLVIDTNQDTIQSFATEDTPFSGSAPQSPSLNSARLYDSPQMNRNANSQPQFMQNTNQAGGIRKSEISQNKIVPIQNGSQFQNYCLNRMERSASTNIAQTKMPATNPSFSAQLLNNFGYISNDYDAGEDTLKTFATEGTPLNYSRTGSCSDLSSLNANFEEKVRIDVKSNSSSQKNPAEDCGSDDSSMIDENEDLLSQIIQSALPAAKATKGRRSVDRQAEGAERKNNSTTSQTKNLNKKSGLGVQKPASVISSNFQPQWTSSLVQDQNIVHTTQINNDGYDQVKTYAVEDTPNNLSEATSLSDLSLLQNGPNAQFKTKRNMPTSNTDQSIVKSFNRTTSTYAVSNDSVFLDSDFETGNSLKVYQVEGTPQSFSCNESLSSLGIVDDESSNKVLQQVKLIVQQLTKSESKPPQNITSGKVARGSSAEHGMASTDKIERPHSRASVNSTKSVLSGKEMERHVIGQSNADQSLHEHEEMKKQTTDEVRNYEVEDAPICFSRCSSLSSVHDMDNDVNRNPKETKSIRKPAVDTDNKLASKDESAAYKVEHTPICFSRNSSLTSLSVHSDDDDDPNDMALLEDCISSALPPRTRPYRVERHRPSFSSRTEPAGTISSRSGNDNHISINKSLKNNACLGDELEQPGSHDSRISKWKQPSKSKEEIFRKPTMDAKGQPCGRSRSQDSEKHLKDLSNQQIINLNAHRGSFDSLTFPPGTVVNTTDDIEKHQQEIISVSQNLTRSIEHHVRKLNRSTDKLDDNESEKSPFEEYNFFMTCSGATEINVKSINKQSLPGSIAPDNLMDSTFSGSQRIDADGEIGNSSCETTLTDRNIPRPLNGSLTVSKGKRGGMEGSLTLEDERALAENANIVMSEMMVNRMLVSGASIVDEENFIENETLALVANEYVSDTASEGSFTWSAVSDSANECLSNKTEVNSQMSRRTRILKPGGKDQIHYERETEVKAVRGKRKPLYGSKSVSSASQSTKLPDKNRADNGTGVAHNISPRIVPGAPSPANTSGSRKTHNLRTMPQASSTPVKSNSPSKPCSNKPSPTQKTSSFEQKIQNVKTVSATRSGGVSCSNNTPTRISSRSSPRGNVSAKEPTDRPKNLMKQATFIKESTNKNAPVISSNENKQNIPGVKMRQSKLCESSQNNRNSSGSSKSNLSNTSHNSLSTSSSDSPPDSWSKTLNTYNFVNEQLATDAKTSTKESTTRGSFGAGQTSASKHRMNSCPATRIPSPAHVTLNKTNSGSNLKNVGIDSKVIKSSSGTLFNHTNTSDLMKTGSVNSLKQNSHPTTLANVNIRNRSGGAMVTTKQDDSLKQTEKKTVTSKFAGLWKSEKTEEKSKIKSEMQISSKLPVARSKKKNETVKEQEVKKREPSPKQSVNRNTYILNESIADRVSKSSTYDKLNVTTDKSQIPSHGQDEHDAMIKSGTSNSSGSSNSSKTKSVFDQNSELNKTCRDISANEIGVEYNLDDAWACSIEKSIEVMSRSIEDNKNRIDSFYDDTVDTSRMDLTGSPAKRLSKSGSMSEIELEFGRIHSGTWTKKKSHNDFNTLPNAEETNRVIPLVKRSESLNFQTEMSVSHFYESEDNDVWIRRDDKMRSSDVTISRKKKKSFGGSSSFLNIVSKMFGVSKKSGDKQGKSSSAVCEKHIKTKNESNAKVKNEKYDKANKSETQASKAEAKLLKAEQKAKARQLKMQAKMNKSEIKASKEEAKLSKRRKSESSQYVDNTSQYLSSSTSSLKRSAADLIDIDKSDDDDDDVCKQNEKFAIPLFVSQTCNDRKSGFHNDLTDIDQKGNIPVAKSPGRQKTLALKSDSFHKSPQFSKHYVPFQYNADHSASLSVSVVDTSIVNMSVKQRTEQDNASTNTLNKSVKLSNSPLLTKTEMLLARRQMQLGTAESGESGDEEAKRKFIITTV